MRIQDLTGLDVSTAEELQVGNHIILKLLQKMLHIENSPQCYVAAWMGGDFGGEWIHVYAWLSPYAIHLKLSQHY